MSDFKQLKKLISQYIDSIDSSSSDNPNDVFRVLRYINERLCNENLNITEIRERCYISDRNFSGRFKACTGFSPKRYILYHRINLAKKILSDNRFAELSISEISFYIGFKTSSAFTRLFKKRVGQTPFIWRKNL